MARLALAVSSSPAAAPAPAALAPAPAIVEAADAVDVVRTDALLDALTHHQVGQVVVRNIGERMLSRLLAANIRVVQCRSARLPLPALLAPANLQPLTESSQGRPSRRHPHCPSL
jgi:hypothetical protein